MQTSFTSEISGASLLSIRILDINVGLQRDLRRVTSTEGKPAQNSHAKVKTTIGQIEAQMQHLKINSKQEKDEYITYIHQKQSKCSFVVLNPKTKKGPSSLKTYCIQNICSTPNDIMLKTHSIIVTGCMHAKCIFLRQIFYKSNPISTFNGRSVPNRVQLVGL